MSIAHNHSFYEIALQRSVVIRAVRISAVVGVVLAIINHGDRIFGGQIDIRTALKIGLTFLVPYCVSTFSSVLAVRDRIPTAKPTRTS
ncbi:nitrate/nitrite transporter NrtS [Celeribacter halophilus]|uniref:nitrate/nitrite transporter NrtS n=1 Tax=Celeribacter halophilus TaxID=576117 RepID=UPI0026E2E1C1|nr:nitrate/nitrite transporter NrtS [Celeribacter halophilus]